MYKLYIAKNKRRKLVLFFSTVIFFNLTVSLIVSYLGNLFDLNPKNGNLSFDSILEEFTLVVILAPILETLIFQNILIELTLKFTNKHFLAFSYYLAVIIPALCFGFSHGNNLLYIINTFLGGISLNLLYLYTKENYLYPFISTAIAHSIYNLIIFGFKHC